MAACKPVRTQIIRGIIGMALLMTAGFVYSNSVALSVFLVVLSIIPLKGCPVCWIVETCDVVDKSRRDKKQEKT
jgi:hypothetical protein